MNRRMALPVVLALLLAGCASDTGDDHDHGDHGHGDGQSGDGSLPIDGTEEMVHVIAGDPDEFRYDHARIEVRSGERVGIMFHNEGQEDHEFVIEALDFHLHVQPGGMAQAAFIAPAPGQYEIGCYIAGHFEAGMRGTLVVS